MTLSEERARALARVDLKRSLRRIDAERTAAGTRSRYERLDLSPEEWDALMEIISGDPRELGR